MNQTKKKEGLSRLFEIAGQKKGLLVMAGVLSAGSAMCMLVPYWAVYEVLKELLTHGGNPAASDGAVMIRWGWIAFGGLVGGLVLLYAALMSSHIAAFRILYGLRVRLSEHIGRLPLGYLNNTSTGAIKKTMDQNIEKIEGFIAHTIPDLVNVVATVAVGSGDACHLLFAGCVADGRMPDGHSGQSVSSILQFHGQKGKGVYGHLLRCAGKDERVCRAICAGDARSQDIRAECPFVPSVQCRNPGI